MLPATDKKSAYIRNYKSALYFFILFLFLIIIHVKIKNANLCNFKVINKYLQ